MSTATAPTIIDKLKQFSITHIISIFALMITNIVVNAIYWYESGKYGVLAAIFSDGNFMWLTFFNIASVAGMSYYAYRVAVSAQGMTVETIPSTPTPAAQQSTVTLSDQQVQQIVAALQKATPAPAQ